MAQHSHWPSTLTGTLQYPCHGQGQELSQVACNCTESLPCDPKSNTIHTIQTTQTGNLTFLTKTSCIRGHPMQLEISFCCQVIYASPSLNAIVGSASLTSFQTTSFSSPMYSSTLLKIPVLYSSRSPALRGSSMLPGCPILFSQDHLFTCIFHSL